MRKILLALTMALCCFAGMAQRTKTKVNGYGAASVEMNRMLGKARLGVGGYGGVLLNHKWLIGAAGNNVFLKSTKASGQVSRQYNSYGLYTEYHFSHQRPVHVVAGLMAGAGYLQERGNTAPDEYKRVGDWHYVVAPNLGVAVDITSFMRVHARVGYTIAGDPNYTPVKADELRSLSGGLSVVFGKF